MIAYINHGRWVAHCETEWCAGAEQLWPGGQIRQTVINDPLTGKRVQRRYGITRGGLLHCGNCGQTTKVEWPEDRSQIERLLKRRPVPQTRNWLPGETAADLAAENIEHGVGVD